MLTLQDFRIKTSYLAKIRTVNAIPKNPVNTPWSYIRTRDKFDEPIFDEELIYVVGAYVWEKKHFNLQSVKLAFLSFFPAYSTYFGIFHVVQVVKYVQS